MKKARIDKETEVTVANNTWGSFGYNFKETVIELDEHGDEDYLTFGELRTMASSKHKGVLQNLYLLITDIDSDEYTVRDVISQLKLDKYYKNAWDLIDVDIDEEEDAILQPDDFEDFVKDCKPKELKKKLEDDSLDGILIETAAHLYKSKKLTDFDKMHIVGRALGINEDDISAFFADMNPKASV